MAKCSAISSISYCSAPFPTPSCSTSPGAYRRSTSTVLEPEVAKVVGPVAIVARNELSLAQALRFARGAGVDRPIRFFGDGLEARKWLLSFRQAAV